MKNHYCFMLLLSIILLSSCNNESPTYWNKFHKDQIIEKLENQGYERNSTPVLYLQDQKRLFFNKGENNSQFLIHVSDSLSCLIDLDQPQSYSENSINGISFSKLSTLEITTAIDEIENIIGDIAHESVPPGLLETNEPISDTLAMIFRKCQKRPLDQGSLNCTHTKQSSKYEKEVVTIHEDIDLHEITISYQYMSSVTSYTYTVILKQYESPWDGTYITMNILTGEKGQKQPVNDEIWKTIFAVFR